MKTCAWILGQLFNLNKTEQEKLEWNWFWSVEVLWWWENTFVSRTVKRCILAFHRKDSSKDEIPF